MKTIRLLRDVNEPTGRGPGNGMAALQRALRDADLPWLRVGGHLLPGDIPWVWSYLDSEIALQFNAWGWPFICGPNVFFGNSNKPGTHKFEKDLLNAENCQMLFTESEWYGALIKKHCNRNEAPIALWSYPIEPQPEGPLEPEFDLLIYLKDMCLGREMIRAQRRWPNHNVVVYGKYDREQMIACARRSRACLYLSTDDRGPLALAEILLAGCPAIGVPRGSPWIETGISGVSVPHFGKELAVDAEQKAMAMDRALVRAWALDRFATHKTVSAIQTALEPIALREYP